jgi:molybdopterin molybdotransferase
LRKSCTIIFSDCIKDIPIMSQISCHDGREPDALHVEEALNQMLTQVTPVKGYEQVGLVDAVSRVLHEPVISPFAVPSENNSAVDGYAVHSQDLPQAEMSAELMVIGTALAGEPFEGKVNAGQTVRIMTGATLPEGTDTVLMQEQVESIGDHIRIRSGHHAGDHVRLAGEDIQKDTTVLCTGRYLTPPDIGLVASLGMSEVKVKRRPRVALLSTGDEIRPMGRILSKGSIYDSNRYTLQAALKRLSVKVMDQGIVPDDPERLKEALLRAAASADVIISSGGVSVGTADFVKSAVASIGAIDFWKIAMKPGRPLAFGNIAGTTFIGLPGNPVAVMVGFYQFVLPLLEKKMGILDRPVIPSLKARSLVKITKRAGRTEYQRGLLERGEGGKWQVQALPQQGSGMLRSMSLANSLMILPHECDGLAPGEWVEVLPFAAFM